MLHAAAIAIGILQKIKKIKKAGKRGIDPIQCSRLKSKGVEVQLLLFESFGGFGKGVGEILWKAANVLHRTS